MAKRKVEFDDQEKEIIENMRKNPLWGFAQFTDYFMRASDTGTWITEEEDDFMLDADTRYGDGKVTMYEYLSDEWLAQGRPDVLNALPPMFASYYAQSIPYSVIVEKGSPQFFWNHGWVPLEWGAVMHYAKQKEHTILGGFGCFDIDTRIYDAELGYLSARQLIEMRRVPVVLAHNGEGLVPVQAEAILSRGRAEMYKVTLDTGDYITVTADHRFLTGRGYVRTDGLRLRDELVVPGEQLSEGPGGAQYARQRSETVPGSLDGYSAYYHQRDERLLRAPAYAQSSPPSLPGGHMEPLGGLSRSHPATRHSVGQALLHGHGLASYRSGGASGGPARRQRRGSGPSRFLDTTSLLREGGLLRPGARPVETYASATVPENGMATSDLSRTWRSGDWSNSTPPPCTLGAENHAYVPVLLAPPHSATSSPSNTFLSTTTAKIVSIEAVGERDVYDLSVPEHHSYVAEGMVHHNCSKTTHVGMSGFVYCATVPRFRFVCVAAFLSNAKPMYQEIRNAIEDTPAMKFLGRARNGEYMWSESPTPRIRFYNGSEMIFLGADKDIQKVRSESGDWYVVEQSESHSDLGAVTLELGTRGRGRVRGRKRLGRLTFVANSGESPELWERFDKADTDPQVYWSLNLSSYDNAWLSDEDIKKLERSCGGDSDTIDQYMLGLKPIGKFKSFPKNVVARCEAPDLDSLMHGLREDYSSGAREVAESVIGHTMWSLPPADGRDYAVYGDPGTKNPPARGAGTVLVFDETDFPNRPAELVHFHWVAGNGQIGPWLNAFEDACNRYGAHGRAYFEGTGDQKMLDELSFEDRQMVVQRVDMSQIKYGYFLKTLRIMERGLIRWPREISGIRVQMSKYDVDKDKASSTMPQDIVMTILIVGGELSKRFIPEVRAEQQGAFKRSIRVAKRAKYSRHRTVLRSNR